MSKPGYIKLNGRVVPADALLIPESADKVFSGKLFDIYQWQQKLPDGSTALYEMAKRRDSVHVIAVLNGKIGCIAYKAPNMKQPKVSLPGGKVDPGETPLEAAKRELKEETGLSLSDWKQIDVVQPEEKIEWFLHVFVAYGEYSQGNPDVEPGEEIEFSTQSFEELKRLESNSKRLRALSKWDSLDDLLASPDLLAN